MPEPHDYFVLASVEGLHLTTDLMIGAAILVGSGVGYVPVLPEEYREPRNSYGVIPFSGYRRLRGDVPGTAIDEESLQVVGRLAHGLRIADHACITFSVRLNRNDYTMREGETGTGLLEWLLRLGDQIVDLLRLFLYRPGDGRLIGRAGSLGRGVYGLWLCSSSDQSSRFIGRQLSRFALVPDPVRLDLDTFRGWYSTDTFAEFRTVVGTHPDEQVPLYDKAMAALRSFRECREMQSLEGRFRQLTSLIEDLAQHEGERLIGSVLYIRIAQVAWFSLRDTWDDEPPLEDDRWRTWQQLAGDVSGLWQRIRNPLAHSCRVIQYMPVDPERDLVTAETLAVSMIRGLARACFESGATGRDPYEILAHIDPDDLQEIEPQASQRPVLAGQNFEADSLRTHRDSLAREFYGQSHSQAQS